VRGGAGLRQCTGSGREWISGMPLGEAAFLGEALASPDPFDRRPMTSNDPLLQPFRLKNLTLRNRLMSTAHEPAYTEDGMPKERYRLYHAAKAKGGIAL